MKKIKIFSLFLLTLLLFTSCRTGQNANANTNSSESPTKEPEAVVLKPALLLDDYDDYLLYREGKLDVEDHYYGWFGTDPKVFIDVRSLLNLSELPDGGYKEEIAILSDKEFIYYIYSVGDDGKTLKTEFTAIVSYEEDRVKDVPDTPSFDSIKANTKNEPYFNIRKGKNALSYSQNNQIYTSFSVHLEDYRISFLFDRDGLTPKQIEEKFGKLMASLVSENDEELSRGVETIASALDQES